MAGHWGQGCCSKMGSRYWQCLGRTGRSMNVAAGGGYRDWWSWCALTGPGQGCCSRRELVELTSDSPTFCLNAGGLFQRLIFSPGMSPYMAKSFSVHFWAVCFPLQAISVCIAATLPNLIGHLGWTDRAACWNDSGPHWNNQEPY